MNVCWDVECNMCEDYTDFRTITFLLSCFVFKCCCLNTTKYEVHSKLYQCQVPTIGLETFNSEDCFLKTITTCKYKTIYNNNMQVYNTIYNYDMQTYNNL